MSYTFVIWNADDATTCVTAKQCYSQRIEPTQTYEFDLEEINEDEREEVAWFYGSGKAFQDGFTADTCYCMILETDQWDEYLDSADEDEEDEDDGDIDDENDLLDEDE